MGCRRRKPTSSARRGATSTRLSTSARGPGPLIASSAPRPATGVERLPERQFPAPVPAPGETSELVRGVRPHPPSSASKSSAGDHAARCRARLPAPQPCGPFRETIGSASRLNSGLYFLRGLLLRTGSSASRSHDQRLRRALGSQARAVVGQPRARSAGRLP